MKMTDSARDLRVAVGLLQATQQSNMNYEVVSKQMKDDDIVSKFWQVVWNNPPKNGSFLPKVVQY